MPWLYVQSPLRGDVTVRWGELINGTYIFTCDGLWLFTAEHKGKEPHHWEPESGETGVMSYNGAPEREGICSKVLGRDEWICLGLVCQQFHKSCLIAFTDSQHALLKSIGLNLVIQFWPFVGLICKPLSNGIKVRYCHVGHVPMLKKNRISFYTRLPALPHCLETHNMTVLSSVLKKRYLGYQFLSNYWLLWPSWPGTKSMVTSTLIHRSGFKCHLISICTKYVVFFCPSICIGVVWVFWLPLSIQMYCSVTCKWVWYDEGIIYSVKWKLLVMGSTWIHNTKQTEFMELFFFF